MEVGHHLVATALVQYHVEEDRKRGLERVLIQLHLVEGHHVVGRLHKQYLVTLTTAQVCTAL